MGDISYRPFLDEMTWSYSRLSTFHDCPYKFFLKYIHCCKDAPRFYSSYGKFMHKLLEEFYKGEISQDDMQIKFLLDFHKEVQGDRPKDSIVQGYIRQGVAYLKQFQPLPFKTVAVEQEIHFSLADNPFVGVVDFVGEDENGELVIVDHKSRALQQRSGRKTPTVKDRELDEMLRQLYIYAEAVRQEYGRLPKKLCFNCFRNGELIIEQFDGKAYRQSLDWAKRQIEDVYSEEDFDPFREFFSCYYLCGVRDECCYWEMR